MSTGTITKYVAAEGDTMTGHLRIDESSETNGVARIILKGNRKSKAGTDDAGSSNRPFGGIYIYDGSTNSTGSGSSNDGSYNVFYNECTLHANNNSVYSSYVVRRQLEDGTAVSNGFFIGIHTDGTAYVSFSGGGHDAWLSGLGFLKESLSPTVPASNNLSTSHPGLAAFNFLGAEKCGYMVSVSFDLSRNTTAVTGWTDLITGLPKPSHLVYDTKIASRNFGAEPLMFRLTTGGVLQYAWGAAAGSTNAHYYETLTYIANTL